ncbi:MAG: MBL fold metallo-hydrolase [Chitinophagaceae bacterium]
MQLASTTFGIMSMFIASLNSGSNANCYYVGNRQDAVLIDAGLSCRETERRMKKLELSLGNVRALFVSHEHSDHISGVPGLARKYKLPVYITAGTLRNGNIPLDPEQVHSFSHAKPVSIGEMAVIPFRKSHDAADPYSFMISGAGVNIGVITDIGYACKRVIRYFNQCDAAFLEANYCEDMLENGAYPYPLKKRIRSDEGHLSNAQALELFRQYRSPQLQLLILSHLSKNNNRPERVQQLFEPHAGNTKIFVASRYDVSPVFEIQAGTAPAATKPVISRHAKKKPVQDERQLTLF